MISSQLVQLVQLIWGKWSNPFNPFSWAAGNPCQWQNDESPHLIRTVCSLHPFVYIAYRYQLFPSLRCLLVRPFLHLRDNLSWPIPYSSYSFIVSSASTILFLFFSTCYLSLTETWLSICTSHSWPPTCSSTQTCTDSYLNMLWQHNQCLLLQHISADLLCQVFSSCHVACNLLCQVFPQHL